MHWFVLDELSLEDLEAGLLRVANATPPITLMSESADLFGTARNVPVHVLRENKDLEALHRAVYQLLLAGKSLSPYRQWIGANYRPHVASYAHKVFPPGSRHKPRCLTLVRRGENKWKQVLGSFVLRGRR